MPQSTPSNTQSYTETSSGYNQEVDGGTAKKGIGALFQGKMLYITIAVAVLGFILIMYIWNKLSSSNQSNLSYPTGATGTVPTGTAGSGGSTGGSSGTGSSSTPSTDSNGNVPVVVNVQPSTSPSDTPISTTGPTPSNTTYNTYNYDQRTVSTPPPVDPPLAPLQPVSAIRGDPRNYGDPRNKHLPAPPPIKKPPRAPSSVQQTALRDISKLGAVGIHEITHPSSSNVQPTNRQQALPAAVAYSKVPAYIPNSAALTAAIAQAPTLLTATGKPKPIVSVATSGTHHATKPIPKPVPTSKPIIKKPTTSGGAGATRQR